MDFDDLFYRVEVDSVSDVSIEKGPPNKKEMGGYLGLIHSICSSLRSESTTSLPVSGLTLENTKSLNIGFADIDLSIISCRMALSRASGNVDAFPKLMANYTEL